ncbi:DUF302 domain-containing protein [Gryllotalpicola daejeonensis]
MGDNRSFRTERTAKTVDDAVAALRAAVERRGITVSAVIDHAAAAQSAGVALAGETVVIFGNPSVGTAVMLADARAGLDLPLRVLVRETATGAELLYRDPHVLADEFDLSTTTETLDALAGVLAAVTAEAAA